MRDANGHHSGTVGLHLEWEIEENTEVAEALRQGRTGLLFRHITQLGPVHDVTRRGELAC